MESHKESSKKKRLLESSGERDEENLEGSKTISAWVDPKALCPFDFVRFYEVLDSESVPGDLALPLMHLYVE